MSNKATLFTYSPEDIQVAVAGILNITGFVEGSFVTISRDAPLFATTESADGMVSRVKRNSNTYTVSLSLMNTSESNDALTILAGIDHSTSVAKFPLLIKDSLGSTVFFATSAWIENLPSTEYSTTITNRNWNIRCASSTLFVGGNKEPSGGGEDATKILLGLAPTLTSIF